MTNIQFARDAERAACQKLIDLGFFDARLTANGPDGGVDIRSSEAVAQVKTQTNPVAQAVIHAIYGVAQAEGRSAVCFSMSGFSKPALRWASRVDVALFVFDRSGECVAANDAARSLETRRWLRLVPVRDGVPGDPVAIGPECRYSWKGTLERWTVWPWGVVFESQVNDQAVLEAVGNAGDLLMSVSGSDVPRNALPPFEGVPIGYG